MTSGLLAFLACDAVVANRSLPDWVTQKRLSIAVITQLPLYEAAPMRIPSGICHCTVIHFHAFVTDFLQSRVLTGGAEF